MKKYIIEVRNYIGELYTCTKIIKRKIYAEQIGNFNPFFCRFNKLTFQLHSDAGDVSDPFRREENYAETFYIKLNSPCQWSL